MDRRSRHGTAASRRTKSTVRFFESCIIILFAIGALFGCVWTILGPLDLLKRITPLLTPAVVSGQPLVEPTTAVPTGTSLPPTPTETPQPTPTPTPADTATPEPPTLYYTMAGDTLDAVAKRFGVESDEITSPAPIPTDTLLDPNQLLLIPKRLGETSSTEKVFPDSEIVFSPSALDFDIARFVKDAGGYLYTFEEWHTDGWNDGSKAVYSAAENNSINPRLLLALIEYQSHWIYDQPSNLAETDFPVGHVDNQKKGLSLQLSWAVQQLNIGYYGWRAGRVTTITFLDGNTLRLAPDLNAGSVAMLYLMAQLYDQPHWASAMYGPDSLPALYESMFGSPWERAQTVEPLFPSTISQPPLELPFLAGKMWAYTGGPHAAWGPDGARAAIDFAPGTTIKGCYKSDEWVTAMASGLVVRTDPGVVVLDLDGDGYEQTGWSILYLHIATEDKVAVGTWVNTDDHIGHPSCEGGTATGTHVHVARKYNGEWILADGPLPFVLSGWRVHAGAELYEGTLTRDDQTITSSIYGDFESRIYR